MSTQQTEFQDGDIQTIVNSLLKDGNYHDFSIDELIDVLIVLDDEYANDGEISSCDITDQQYDIIRLNTKRMLPNHSYFVNVGSAVRSGKVLLPNPMPSLEQVMVGGVSKWLHSINATDELFTITDKMDGVSLQVVYDRNGDLLAAFSRGNGIDGADVTRHVRKIKDIPQKVNHPNLQIRAEVELSNTAFRTLQMSLKSSSGKRYKNPRNMVAGSMNRSESPDKFYDNVNVFVYQMFYGKANTLSKSQSLDYLATLGFRTVHYRTVSSTELNDEMLSNYLSKRKDALNYEIDGIVITIDDLILADELDRDVSGVDDPKSSIKYKVADPNAFVATPVLDVVYGVSKHGFRKPVIQLQPFDIQGVTVSNTTGFNAKFIRDNKIGPGAVLLMTRSGDVIPFVVEVITSAADWTRPSDLDLYEHQWTETDTDLVLYDPGSHPEVKIQRLIDFSQSMDFPHLRDGSIRKLVEAGYDSISKILHMEIQDLTHVLGANGVKVYDGLRLRTTDIPYGQFLGSTSIFGRGLGRRKFIKLFKDPMWTFDERNVPIFDNSTLAKITDVSGFGDKTADKIRNNIVEALELTVEIQDVVTFSSPLDTSTGKFAKQNICFTGFRDKTLQQSIEQQGGNVQTSVSSKTNVVVAMSANGTSGKLTKARSLGVAIVSKDDFIENYM